MQVQTAAKRAASYLVSGLLSLVLIYKEWFFLSLYICPAVQEQFWGLQPQQKGSIWNLLSWAGNDSEIRGGRLLYPPSYTSQFFPHTRKKLNTWRRSWSSLVHLCVAGDSRVFLSWSFPISKLQIFLPFVQSCPEMLCQWNFPLDTLLQMWIVLLHRMGNNALMKLKFSSHDVTSFFFLQVLSAVQPLHQRGY